MSDYPEISVNPLIDVTNAELERLDAFAALADVRAESVWLANFSSSNTRAAYQRAVGSFIATIGITTPEDLYAVKQAHILAWRASMEAAGLSPSSIASRLAALSSLYKHLTDRQLTTSNPVAGVRRPKTGNAGIGAGKSPTLSKRQVRAMLDAPDPETVQGLRDRALLHIYFFVGARCTEPTLLRVRDFTYDNEFPVLHLTIKGNKTNTVAINLECAAAIRAYLDQADHSRDPDAYMFQAKINGKDGQPMDRSTMYYHFRRYAAKAGIDVAAFPHMARATMITSAYEAGATGEAIQRTVGHSSITTTEGYNHTAKKHRESASLKVGY
ncbi:tyrosine-type recombinase/integrase [Dinoroseobacter sp. S76]|uniref:tyrosine-type recombinase/integrase n=1 Tax=Dinoroseobacter sp. S76 TaxID=3415124 RepID=UPI003C7DE31D